MMDRQNLRCRLLCRVPRLLLLGCLVAACDSGPAALVQEIDRAREGCTEEMLKASDEICVRMFERYADMAADGMETYIGGMRAFDEAIQRRGGLQFDTAGLGSALGERWGAVGDSGYASGFGPARGQALRPSAEGGFVEPQGYFDEPGGYPVEGYGAVSGGRWSDPLPTDAAADPGVGYSPYPAEPADDRAAPSRPARRGVLLPPEERLRRPWIDDAGSAEPYLDGAAPRREVEPLPPPQEPAGWQGEPYPDRQGGSWDAY